MPYINGGAKDKATGMDYKTKKALREAVAENPNGVLFYSTDAFGPNSGLIDPIDKIETVKGINATLSVTGPNPYRSRKWYANITWDSKKSKYVVS